MKKSYVFLLLLMFSALSVSAQQVPTLLLVTVGGEQVQFPIASVQKITYDQSGTTMYLFTADGTQSYAVAEVSQMKLLNVPEPTSIDQLTDSPTQRFSKVVKDGVVYVVKDGKLFTMKGEQLQ